MKDFYIDHNPENGYHLRIFGHNPVIDESLRSAVMVSLFTDRRLMPTDPRPANMDEELDGYAGGYWGDDYPSDLEPSIQARPHGSLLWVLKRAKQIEETRELAEIYCKQALQWLIETQRATLINIEAWWHKPEMLAISLRLSLPDGTVWENQIYQGIANG